MPRIAIPGALLLLLGFALSHQPKAQARDRFCEDYPFKCDHASRQQAERALEKAQRFQQRTPANELVNHALENPVGQPGEASCEDHRLCPGRDP